MIAQVNKNMPRTMGRAFVHVSKFDAIVEIDEQMPELPCTEPGSVEVEIGRNVASLVQDGATLQMGIGAIPNAVLSFLKDKNNLGLHTEMFSDGAVDLMELGVITNDAKTVLPGKAAVSFVMGSRRLYDFVDNNPAIEFQPSDFINDPFIISQKTHRMTAINSALEVDLTGQVGADSIADTLYSGFGGQLDFIRWHSREQEREERSSPYLQPRKAARSLSIVPRLTGGVVTTHANVITSSLNTESLRCTERI